MCFVGMGASHSFRNSFGHVHIGWVATVLPILLLQGLRASSDTAPNCSAHAFPVLAVVWHPPPRTHCGPVAAPLVGPLSCRPGTICPPRELTRSAAVTNNAMGIRAWQTWMHSSARWCFPPVNLSSGRRGRPIGWGHRNSPNSSRKGVFSFPRSYWSCDFGPPLSCRGSPAELLALEAGSGCPRAPVPDA